MLRQEIEAEAVVGLGFHDAPHREETPATAATWHAGHKLQFAALQLCGMSLGLTQTYALVGGLRVCTMIARWRRHATLRVRLLALTLVCRFGAWWERSRSRRRGS